MEFKARVLKNLKVQLDINKFKLRLHSSKNSSIGPIYEENLAQFLEILSKLIYALMNSWFMDGYQMPIQDQYFYWTLNSVEITHHDGYMQI